MAEREYERTGIYEAAKVLWDELEECEGGKASIPPPPRPSGAMGIEESASLEAMRDIAKALQECKKRRPQNGRLGLKMTVIRADAYHVRVRVASGIGDRLAANGFLTFNREEWESISGGDYHVIISSDLPQIDREREAQWIRNAGND